MCVCVLRAFEDHTRARTAVKPPPSPFFASAAHVVADFVYEFFNLCGSVHRLFSVYHGRSSPDHAVHRRGQSGRPLGTGRHDAAASARARRDGRGRKEARHRWHSPSNHDHNRPESGRGASKVGWFMYFYELHWPTRSPPLPLPQTSTNTQNVWCNCFIIILKAIFSESARTDSENITSCWFC